MAEDKYKSLIGKPIYTLSESQKPKKKGSKLATAVLTGIIFSLGALTAQKCDSNLLEYDFRNLNSHQIEGYNPFNKKDLKKALKMEGWNASERNINTYLQVVNSKSDGRAPGFYDLNKDGKILGKKTD